MDVINKILILLLSLCLITPLNAHHGNTEFVEVVPAKFISPNIVFVIDCSSTMRNSKGLRSKFYKAIETIKGKLAGDAWYFSAYFFGDKNREEFYPWTPAGGPGSKRELEKLYRTALKSKQIRSFGKKALSLAIRSKNPLSWNPSMSRTLTVIIISDGGFSEAVGPMRYNSTYDAVIMAQKWREANELFEATIWTIGLENKIQWSAKVKRPDAECQAFLKTLGTKYNGGYCLVRDKK